MKHAYKKQKRSFLFFVTTPQRILILSFLLLVSFSIILFLQQQKDTEKQVHAAGNNQFNHIIGAFSIGSATPVATSLGITADLEYGYDPGASGSKGGMKLIDDMPDEYIRQFAKDNSMSNLTNSMTSHLKTVQNNPNIVAYWVIDDWQQPGTAKDALVQVTSLIHQYTPGKPSICGFAGSLNPGTGGGLDNNVEANFSPQGCDMVAPYIYARPGATPDWGLTSVLPNVFSQLKNQGWNQSQTPLVGVPQAFGGGGWATPDANAVEAQTKGYCQSGAVAIIYYAYNNDTSEYIANNTNMQQGVKAGIADCQAIWGATVSTAPATTGTPQISPVLSPPTLFCMGSCPSATPNPAQINTVISGIPGTNGLVGTGTIGTTMSMSSIMAMIQNLLGSMFGGLGFGSTGTNGRTSTGINMNNVSTDGNITMQNLGGTGTTVPGGGGFGGLSGIENMMSGLGNLLGL